MRALITGGTSGLGAAFARYLSREGYELVLVARDQDRLAGMAKLLPKVETLVADLADPADLERVAARCASTDRPIDLLVNNAGFGVMEPLLGDANLHKHALDVMCHAVLVLAGAAGRAMVARGEGRILNVASLSAFITTGNYSPIKAWVKSYSEGLSLELAGTGVTATAFCPGWIRTEFHQRAGIKTKGIPRWLWADADQVAELAIQDCYRGRVVSVPTKIWKVAAFGLAVLPRPLIRKVSAGLSASRE